MKNKPPSLTSSFKEALSKRRKPIQMLKKKGKTTSQQRWLARQLNDPYVHAAKELGFRSRAAFKILEIDDKYKLLELGKTVIDLGCAPGGWTQVCVERMGTLKHKRGKVIGIDLQAVDPAIPGATILEGDFLEEEMQNTLKAELAGAKVDGVLSDMAPLATGHEQTDHLRIIGLVETALHFAVPILIEGGFFIAKVLQGGTEKNLLDALKYHFGKVVHMKPPSSRKDSRELFVIAMNFKGNPLVSSNADTE
jgi:23S rRNA (uridine2552-2'-O)-methyltransferase